MKKYRKNIGLKNLLLLSILWQVWLIWYESYRNTYTLRLKSYALNSMNRLLGIVNSRAKESRPNWNGSSNYLKYYFESESLLHWKRPFVCTDKEKRHEIFVDIRKSYSEAVFNCRRLTDFEVSWRDEKISCRLNLGPNWFFGAPQKYCYFFNQTFTYIYLNLFQIKTKFSKKDVENLNIKWPLLFKNSHRIFLWTGATRYNYTHYQDAFERKFWITAKEFENDVTEDFFQKTFAIKSIYGIEFFKNSLRMRHQISCNFQM